MGVSRSLAAMSGTNAPPTQSYIPLELTPHCCIRAWISHRNSRCFVSQLSVCRLLVSTLLTRTLCGEKGRRQALVICSILRILRRSYILLCCIQRTFEAGGGWTRLLLRFHLQLWHWMLVVLTVRDHYTARKVGQWSSEELTVQDETRTRFRKVGLWSSEKFFIGPVTL